MDSWLFNRGQEITLWRGPKMWRVSVQLFNAEGFPFKYLVGKDKERLLLRALALIREDVAKDGETVTYLDEAHEHGTALTDFPIEVRRESQDLREFVESPEMQSIIGEMRTDIQLRRIEEESY